MPSSPPKNPGRKSSSLPPDYSRILSVGNGHRSNRRTAIPEGEGSRARTESWADHHRSQCCRASRPPGSRRRRSSPSKARATGSCPTATCRAGIIFAPTPLPPGRVSDSMKYQCFCVTRKNSVNSVIPSATAQYSSTRGHRKHSHQRKLLNHPSPRSPSPPPTQTPKNTHPPIAYIPTSQPHRD